MIRDNTNSVSTSTENITVVTVVTKGPQGAPGPIGPQGPSGSDSDWYEGDGFITSSNDVQITGSLNVLAPALTTSSILLSESIFRIQSINPSALSGDGAYLDISTAGDSDRIDVVLNGPQPKLILNKSGSGFGSQFIFQRDGSTTSFMQVDGSDLVQVAGYYDFRSIGSFSTTLRLYNNANFILQAPTTASGVISSSNYISASEFVAPQGTINQLTASHAITASYALNAGGNSDPFPYTGSAIISGSLTITGSLFVSGATELGGNIFPQTPQGATLGTPEKPFREIYLQSGSISIESDTPGDPAALISNNNGNLDISVGGMRLVEPGNSFIAETGSFSFISGSMTQIGDYVQTGNKIINGNLSVSGNITTNALTASGLIYPTTDGNRAEVIITDGAGNLSFGLPEKLHIQVRNDDSVTIPAGTPIYSTGEIGGSERIKVRIASASDASKMPAIGITETELNTTSTQDGFAIINGIYNTNIIPVSGNPTVGDTIYVDANGGVTTIKPSGSNLIQNIGTVLKAAGGQIQGMKVLSIDRTEVPNLLHNTIFFGSGSDQSQQIHISGALDSTVINNITASGVISSSNYIFASEFVAPQGTINQLTASHAITASHALNAGGGSGFPFVGDAVITGSLTVSSSNNTTSLTLYGSGSNPVFIVQGSAGELFSISDSLSGSLFAVKTAFGLSVLETFSDGKTLIGVNDPTDGDSRALYTTRMILSSDSSITQSLYSISTGSDYDGAFFEYTAKSASNARAGTITAIWSESVVQYTETTTADIGSTSGVELLVEQSQSSYHLHLNTPTNGWKVKTIIRSI